MRLYIFAVFLFYFIHVGKCKLWNKGVVHYAINKKDYDPHSQEVIVSTLQNIEKEICVKFFNTPLNYSASDNEKILYISNPDKRKTCPPEHYDYDGSVVDMPIGYKCLNERDISRIVIDMLRASIERTVQPNSNDLLRKFQEQIIAISVIRARMRRSCRISFECYVRILSPESPTELWHNIDCLSTPTFYVLSHAQGHRRLTFKTYDEILEFFENDLGEARLTSARSLGWNPKRPSIMAVVSPYFIKRRLNVSQNTDSTNLRLLSPSDRNFINAHYHMECGNLAQRPMYTRRYNAGALEVTSENEKFYKDKLWPLGIVMFGADPHLYETAEFEVLHHAMTVIELSSCVVFQQVVEADVLQPKTLLWFGQFGEEVPYLGFREGNQSLILNAMIYGAPGHTAHTLNLLMRVLGVPMMSNRYDRDNYVTINWRNVEKTKEHFLERAPKEAWLKNTDGEGAAYDYDSVTHAPANFMCGDCSLGAQTVQPIQDHLWQKTLTMGHRADLSTADIEMLNLLYNRQCQHRFMSNSK